MSGFKVRLGDQTLSVAGLSELVAMAKAGTLSEEDPVFVPQTGKWHLARAIKPLREHFPPGRPPELGKRQSPPENPEKIEKSSNPKYSNFQIWGKTRLFFRYVFYIFFDQDVFDILFS